jgi:hypothetical protein
VSRRPSLRDLRCDGFDLLDDEWRSPSEFRYWLGLGAGLDPYRLCLVLERLAADGYAELRAKPGSGYRKFRRRQV